MHARHAPKRHVLNYGVWYLCLKLSELSDAFALPWLSRNRFNLFSLRDADYGLPGHTMESWVEHLRREHNLPQGEVVLITMPRVLGYGFNPVSFWFFQDADGATRAVMAEVNNTFGERHCYLCRHPDGRVIDGNDWLHADKVFHVSPFLNVSGTYDFRFRLTDDAVDIWINHNDNDTRMLTTSLTGRRGLLGAQNLLSAFFRYPLVTLKVIAMIHWHAIRLLIKGIRYNVKPQPPKHMVSS